MSDEERHLSFEAVRKSFRVSGDKSASRLSGLGVARLASVAINSFMGIVSRNKFSMSLLASKRLKSLSSKANNALPAMKNGKR